MRDNGRIMPTVVAESLEEESKKRSHDRWVRISLVPMLSVIMTVMIAGSVVVFAIFQLNSQERQNAEILHDLQRTIVVIQGTQTRSTEFHCALVKALHSDDSRVQILLAQACQGGD